MSISIIHFSNITWKPVGIVSRLRKSALSASVKKCFPDWYPIASETFAVHCLYQLRTATEQEGMPMLRLPCLNKYSRIMGWNKLTCPSIKVQKNSFFPLISVRKKSPNCHTLQE